MALPVAAGKPDKVALDLTKLAAPNAFGAPQWSNITTRESFAPVTRTEFGMRIYETNTSNQSQTARFPELSVNGLLL